MTVSEDEQPLLFALTETAAIQVTTRPPSSTRAPRRIGITPYLLYTFGE